MKTKQNSRLEESCSSLSAECLAERGGVLLDGGLVFFLNRVRGYFNRGEAVVNLVVSVAVNVDLAVFTNAVDVESRRTTGIREIRGISLVPALADESVIYHVVKVLKGLSAPPLYIISNACFKLCHDLSRAWLKTRIDYQKMSLLDAQCSDILSVSKILPRARRSITAAIDYPQEYLALTHQ